MIFEPAIETRSEVDQRRLDEEAFRKQIGYLFEKSAFYREKLTRAGFPDARSVGGLDEISRLPLTEKDELRRSYGPANPMGTHIAAPAQEIVRIYSTSGTTGMPSYIPLTASDLENWIRTAARSYAASGVSPGERVVTTYNVGPFVAGAALDCFARIGLCHIPIGTGHTERIAAAIQNLSPQALVLTPSYAIHLTEWAQERNLDLRASSIKRIMVAGEPGGGEPRLRESIENAWNAQVTEAMGIGDISVSLWGECEEQQGMHFCGRDFVHFELIDPESGMAIPIVDGAKGELVLTHLNRRAAPLLRFRTRDHVVLWTEPCRCGRTSPRVRCIGRTDDMLIVRGVNVFPTAIREVVSSFKPAVTGVISVRPGKKGVDQLPPLRVLVEVNSEGEDASDLADKIEKQIRALLVFTAKVELVPRGHLERSEYKSKLVSFADASA